MPIIGGSPLIFNQYHQALITSLNPVLPREGVYFQCLFSFFFRILSDEAFLLEISLTCSYSSIERLIQHFY